MNNEKNRDWVLVYTTSDEIEALLIKGMLENVEIAAQVLSQIDTTRQFNVGGLAIAKIYVLKEDYETAKELIEANEWKEE
ncbi:MAG: DUF2007 domain-containing protein [Candidatus Kapaibacterium sp.]|nr:DUF2007 domain-containing protein [Ignavibacteriota bacterium]